MTLNTELLFGKNPAAGGYQIERSLRFNSSDSAYLSRTPSSAGNRKTFTYSCWFKRVKSSENRLLLAKSGSAITYFMLNDFVGDALTFAHFNGSGHDFRLITSRLFRDFSAWYHIVLSVDTTQATASERIKIYVNGTQETAFHTANYPSQNTDWFINNTVAHQIGNDAGADKLDGYLADVHFIDGQALDPTSFGEFDANGVWQPIAYTGSYGTNGFHLPFSDNSTAAALGTDTSRAGNNWTVNNISVAAGAGNDSLVDTPTNYGTDTGAGGEVRGNYCTWNPLDSARQLANGNLEYTAATLGIAKAGIAVSSGKWYWECQQLGAGNAIFGICAAGESRSISYLGITATSYGYRSNAVKVNSASTAPYGTSLSIGDTVGVALDLDAGTLTFYVNGVSQGVAFSSLSGTFVPACGNNVSNDAAAFNFGQRPFAYPAPSGFKALCTTNLPAPVVAKPSEVMDVALYTGNGSARSITGLGFSPDFVWIKGRSGATDHALYDAVRGAQKDLVSNSTAAETTQAQGLTAFNSDGFSLGTLAKLNTNAATYAGWCWDAGSSTVTNNDGTFASEVRANPSAGFSVLTWNSSGAGSVGHGLGVAPGFIFLKPRSSSINSWLVYHSVLGLSGFLTLNGTGSAGSSTNIWGGTNSSVIGFSSVNNASLGSCVGYCFAPVAGYSSFGSYTGNGSADGPFVYTGFRPRWILYKNTQDGSTFWGIYDSARDSFNASGLFLPPNLSNAEVDARPAIDFTSNGFKIRNAGTGINGSGHAIIYAAFAESPFQYARAR